MLGVIYFIIGFLWSIFAVVQQRKRKSSEFMIVITAFVNFTFWWVAMIIEFSSCIHKAKKLE